MRAELTQERLKEVLHYSPDTGVLTWAAKTSRKVVVGSSAGSIRVDGYIHVGVDGTRYLAHRLAWLHVYGAWPTKHLDHVDGDRSNNSMRNLRVCTDAENGQNRKGPNANSRTGYLGVTYDRRYGTYSAHITRQGVKTHLGTFSTPEEAHQAYLAAKARYHTFQPVPRDT